MIKIKNCLLVETEDNRQFLTDEKNYYQLIEFAKTFNAEISVIEVLGSPMLLDLKSLAAAISDSTYSANVTDYKLIEKRIAKNSIKQSNPKTKKSDQIVDWIEQQLLSGKTLSYKDIQTEFNDSLSDASFCNYFSKVRNKMKSQGYKFTKVSAGNYKIENI